MADRPHIDNLSIWDCTTMEINRDLDHNCLEIVCRGEDKYARLRVTVWSAEEGKAPVVKIDKTITDPPAPLTVETLLKGLDHEPNDPQPTTDTRTVLPNINADQDLASVLDRSE